MELKRTEGDPLADLSEQLRPYVLKAIRPYGLPEEVVEDVAQQTWLLFLSHRASISDQNAIPSWLWTTASRQALRAANLARREIPVDDWRGRSHPTSGDDVDEELVRQCCIDALRRVIAGLPQQERRLIGLLLHEPRLSYTAMAEYLGIRPGSVGPLRTHCLQTLRRRLGAEGITSA